MFDQIFRITEIDGGNGLIINGLEGTRIGQTVSSIGDFNGDGFDDILLGANNTDPNGILNAGQSYVVFGRPQDNNFEVNLSELNGQNGVFISGVEERSFSSISISEIGDFNNDGLDDIIIGSLSSSIAEYPDVGKSYVVFGNNNENISEVLLGDLDGNNGFVITGEIGAGRIVSEAGDINGDGFDDLLVSSPTANYADFKRVGQSYVLFGHRENILPEFNLSDLDGNNGFVVNGIDSGDQAGFSISQAGDFNGDGFDDFLIGAPGGDGSSADPFANFGEVYLIFGKDQPFDPVLNLSDIDGKNGFRINGISPNSIAGYSLNNAGDINGDGFDDILIGAIAGNSTERFYAGKCYVIFGGASPFSRSFNLSDLNGSNGFIINWNDVENRNYDTSIRPLSSAGDFNGDGLDDILLGAELAESNEQNDEYDSGEGYIIFGKTSNFSPSFSLSDLDGQNGFVIDGVFEGANLGLGVSKAGDFNQDGVDDIVLGSTIFPDGHAYILYGKNVNENDRIDGTANSELLRGTRQSNVIFGKRGNDTLRGFGGDDRLSGNAGNDFLVGGAGNDRLIGGNGFDSLKGGDGEDKFIFQNLRQKPDRILDFNESDDLILVGKSDFDLDLPKGRLAIARFTLGSSAQDRSDRFIYDATTGALLFDSDGTGNQGAKTIVYLNQNQELNAANIRIF